MVGSSCYNRKEIADKTSNRITFIEIHELFLPKGRIVLFQIPAAPLGLPVAFDGHWYGRDGESLVALNIEELERIRSQNRVDDWSAEIVQEASIQDLDEKAIAKAQTEFVKRNPKYNAEIGTWDIPKFLDKAKITIGGKITRTALILLGKEEAEHYLGSFVKIRWNLKTVDNQDLDFEVFSIPLLLAVDEVYAKIRNLKYRYLRDGTLFPDEVLRYEPFNIRESLNNAIAHQDYTNRARINVVEFGDDRLVVSNYGSFIPKSVEDVVLKDTPEEFYRNPFLVEVMKNLDMIETQGGGIRKIFNFQKDRFFPLPEYDLSGGKVKITITGKILNEHFARILIDNPSLSLHDILLLDRVQKRLPLNDKELTYLKRLNFIEGRKPNIYLSYFVVQPTKDDNLKADYIRNKSFDDEHFKNLILDYLRKYPRSKRAALDTLLVSKLSDVLSYEQKRKKVSNLISSLKSSGHIKVNKSLEWELEV